MGGWDWTGEEWPCRPGVTDRAGCRTVQPGLARASRQLPGCRLKVRVARRAVALVPMGTSLSRPGPEGRREGRSEPQPKGREKKGLSDKWKEPTVLVTVVSLVSPSDHGGVHRGDPLGRHSAQPGRVRVSEE